MKVATYGLWDPVMGPWSGESFVTKGMYSKKDCTFNQILFLHKTQEQKQEWMSMILFSIGSGQRITIFGTCNQEAQRIDATRVLLEKLP